MQEIACLKHSVSLFGKEKKATFNNFHHFAIDLQQDHRFLNYLQPINSQKFAQFLCTYSIVAVKNMAVRLECIHFHLFSMFMLLVAIISSAHRSISLRSKNHLELSRFKMRCGISHFSLSLSLP